MDTMALDRFVTLTRAGGVETVQRITERTHLFLRPTQAGEPRGKWLAEHWLGLGYQTIDGTPIDADSVCAAIETETAS